MKKIFILVLLSFSFVSVYANTQIDFANNLANKWIINDNSNNPENYDLSQNVLRQEIAAVARGVYESRMEVEIGSLKKNNCDNIFSDVSSTNPNSWACYSVEALVDNELITRNETFRPEDNITKSESLWMLIKAIGFDYSYNPALNTTWQEQIVDFSVKNWVVENFSDYNSDASRWWIFEAANHVIKIKEEQKYQKIISWEAL